MRRVAGKLRGLVPEPVQDRLRLTLAFALETRARWSRTSRGAAIVWHAVAERGGDPAVEIDPPLSRRRLEDAVRHLTRRYALVRAGDLPAAVRRRRRGESIPIALTFDDDLPSHLEHAAPVLARHGGMATAFLCGAPSPFWWQRLQTAVDAGALGTQPLPHVPAPLVSEAHQRRPGAIRRLARAVEDLDPSRRDEVAAALAAASPAPPLPLGPDGARKLAGAGWELGFHSRRHDPLTGLGDDALRAALVDGRDGLPAAPRAFAYPHGKAGAREAAAARAAGYAVAYTGRPDIVTAVSDPHLLGRLQPQTASPGRFALSLARMLIGGGS